jgi:hypothetical protein
MLVTEKKEKVEMVDEVKACVCDKCGKVVKSEDVLEFQEMHHISFQGGYNSIFGDSMYVEADLCQACLYGYIYKYARIVDPYGTEEKE